MHTMTINYTSEDIRNLKRLMESEEASNHQLGALMMVTLGIIPQEVYNCMEAYGKYKLADIQFVENDDFEIFIDIDCPCSYKQQDVINHIYKIQNLVGFYFVCNDIVMPNSLFEISNLRELSISVNPNKGKEEKLFQQLSQFKKLEHLRLNMCELDFIPVSIKNLTQLKYLILSNNHFEELPLSLSELTQLEYLDITRNKFHHFPTVICQLKNLKRLRLNDMKFTQLPKEMLNLKNLEKLDLNYIKLDSFPEVIFEMYNLKEVKIRKKNFSETEIERAQNIMGDVLKVDVY